MCSLTIECVLFAMAAREQRHALKTCYSKRTHSIVRNEDLAYLGEVFVAAFLALFSLLIVWGLGISLGSRD